MTMNKEKCINLYKLIIREAGRPNERILMEYFSTNEAMEISRQLNIGKLAIFSDKQLTQFAKTALQKIA